MLNKIFDIIALKLINSERFWVHIEELMNSYRDSSLKTYQVWGDKSRIQIGKDVHLNDALINTVSGNVIIGDEAFMGHGVSLLTGTHDYHKIGIERQTSIPSHGRDILIGKGVWIASKAIVLGPCEIGEHSVIAAGSIVKGKVQSHSVYAGAPAKFVRSIRSDIREKS
jgi:acetyltransferase-like isoleucine patch superfamily enzyme